MTRPEHANPAAVLRRAFDEAVAAARSDLVVPPHLPAPPPGRLVVVGAGKAAAAMARSVERHYGADRVEGLVITRDAHSLPLQAIEVVEARHPLPDARGLRATERILALLGGLGADDLVVCLMSGGGSALMSAPDGVTLEQLVDLNRELLRCGADIYEINAVRKHLSRVKGGRLAVAAAPARLVALLVSDVAGDDPSTIASGVSVADPTTFSDALAVLDRYGVGAGAARAALEAGARGGRPETPKPGDPALAHAVTEVVASAQRSLEAAAATLRTAGFAAHILSDAVTGEAREVGAWHAALALQVARRGQPFVRPCALLSGGETTVSVRGDGRGGRNGEFALGFALALPADADAWLLAADTDGIDGSEDNAGVLAAPGQLHAIDRLVGRAALARNDSYAVWREAGALFHTGPTRTNVNDLRIVLLG